MNDVNLLRLKRSANRGQRTALHGCHMVLVGYTGDLFRKSTLLRCGSCPVDVVLAADLEKDVIEFIFFKVCGLKYCAAFLLRSFFAISIYATPFIRDSLRKFFLLLRRRVGNVGYWHHQKTAAALHRSPVRSVLPAPAF